MKVFFLDLWLDLKEKKLAPIAIILLAGIVAIPFVVKKNDEEPPPPPAATTASVAPATPVVSGESADIQTDSRLTVFSPRDPFEPTEAPATETSTSSTSSSGSTSSTTTTETTSSSGGSTSGGSTSGGGTTGTEPSTGTDTSTGTTTTQTKATLFTYTVDIKFGQAGDVKTYKNVRRLELIPNENDPKIVFLGVTATARTAVFLVDGSIGVDTGEGRCRPSADECTFLYLRPDEDHDQATLTDSDGNVYHLRLIDINRITVSSSNGTSGSGNSNSNSNSGDSNSTNSPAFTGSAGRSDTAPGESPPGEPDKPFTYPGFFADSSK